MTGAEFDGVDIDLLADYIGGALAGTPDEPVVAALVDDDPAWRAAYESLTGGMAFVGAELGRLEAEPMPAELAAELDAIFRRPAPRLTLVDGGLDEEPKPRPKPATRRLRWAAPIGVAAAAAAFVGFGLPYLVSGSDDTQSDSAVTAAGGAAESQADTALAAPEMQILATGTDYSADTLAVPPPQPMAAPELSAPAAKDNERAAGAAGEPLLGRLAVRAALDACIDAIQQSNGEGPISVQSVDYARFNGSPAVVVRFSAANGQWAWASGPACGTGGSADTLGKVPVR